MTIQDLCDSLSLSVISGTADNRSYSNIYVGDLLSRAMSHVKMDNLWITIMTNANVIAVASLTECAAVILAEGVTLLPDALDAAKENQITVLSSADSVYTICCRIHELEQSQ